MSSDKEGIPTCDYFSQINKGRKYLYCELSRKFHMEKECTFLGTCSRRTGIQLLQLEGKLFHVAALCLKGDERQPQRDKKERVILPKEFT